MNRNLVVTAVIVALFVIYATGCTIASITTPEGVNMKYIDLHPTGNEMEIDAKWQGVGSLSTKRSSEGSEGLVGALGEGFMGTAVPRAVGDAVSDVVDSASNPLN